jgi:sugar phosphate permease
VSALAATLRLPRLTGYKWVILAVGLASQTAISAVRQGLPSIAPALRDTYALSLQQLGLVLAAINVGIVMTLFAWGVLADRIGERTVLAAGLAAAAGALVGAALAPSFGWLLAGLLAAGMAGASAIGASGRAVMGWFDRSERGMALGVRQTGVPLGGGLAAIALPLIVAAFDLRAALLVVAAGCAAAAIVSWRWMREPPPRPAGHVPVVAPPPHRDPRLWRLGAGSSLVVLAQGALFGFLVVFLHDVHGWSVGAAAGALAALYIGGGVARIVAGVWSDRIDERVAPLRRLTALSAALLLLAALLGAAGAPTFLLLPALLAGGVLAASWNGLSLTAATEMSGRERAGTAIGVQNTILNGAGAIAPVAFASVVVASSWPTAWALLALSQLAGVAVLAPLVAEERGRREVRRSRSRRGGPATLPG